MYKYEIKPSLQKKLRKIAKKDRKTYEQILKKMEGIINSLDVEHYKNLRNPLQEYKRVHIGSFVLTFKFDKFNNLISFADYDHHDNIYK